MKTVQFFLPGILTLFLTYKLGQRVGYLEGVIEHLKTKKEVDVIEYPRSTDSDKG